MRTGISLVKPKRVVFSTVATNQPETRDEPVERSWVSGGVWFPRAAQRREMTDNRYEGYRAQVYVVGVDVQRQAMTASGEYSPWQDVQLADVMPTFEVPTPAFDDRTGEVVNQAELDATLELVKKRQRDIMQPEFYEVTAGDPWAYPLPRAEVTETAEEEEEEDAGGGGLPPQEDLTRPGMPAPPRGGGAAPPRGGGRAGGGRAGGGRSGDYDAAEVRRKMREARVLLRQGNPEEAAQLVRPIVEDPNVPARTKQQARELLDEIEAAQRGAEDMTRRRDPWDELVEKGQQIVNVESDDKDPAVWFHDDSVEPGKTYRYRMRLKLWNRYVGKRSALEDPSQAARTVLVGEWSLPSDPITVAPKRHFFVTGQNYGDTPVAQVDVFAWYAGRWYRQRFDVREGDAIGELREIRVAPGLGSTRRTAIDFATGAIVLDLRTGEPVWYRRDLENGEFAYSQDKSVVLVYLDPADQQVKERIDRVDRGDPLYRRLKEESGG
jgi:hypothetical protein